VGSLTFDGVRFVVHSNDHPPRHVHGFAGETEAIVDIRPTETSRWRSGKTQFGPPVLSDPK